jgi:hypothetical protein
VLRAGAAKLTFFPFGANTSVQEEGWLPHCPGPVPRGTFPQGLVHKMIVDWWFNEKNGWDTNSPGICNILNWFM